MREKLAKLAHEQWAGWMKYLFGKCIKYKAGQVQAENGALIIPKWAVERWMRRSRTQYKDLSPAEMDSDRAEADKFLAVLQAELAKANKRLREMESTGCYIADETGHVCGVAEDNKRLRAAVGLALELADVESVKEVLQPWSKAL